MSVPKNNLILEQDDYILPCNNNHSLNYKEENENNYSINHQIEKTVHHDYNMAKGGGSLGGVTTKAKKADSMNKGFVVEYKMKQNENGGLTFQESKENGIKKTKGHSYTKNA